MSRLRRYAAWSTSREGRCFTADVAFLVGLIGWFMDWGNWFFVGFAYAAYSLARAALTPPRPTLIQFGAGTYQFGGPVRVSEDVVIRGVGNGITWEGPR